MSETDSIRMQFIRAFETLYEKNGMKGVSAAAVAKEAGYSRSSFYRSFDSVYDVLDAVEIAATPYEEMAFLVQNANTVNMKTFTDVILDAFRKRIRLICMLSRNASDNHYYERMRSCMKPAFRAQAERVYDLADAEYDVLAEYITSAKLTLLRYWAVNYERTMDLGQLTQLTDSMFEGGFWERVERVAQATAQGQPVERVGIDYFTEKYSWIRSRPMLGNRAPAD